MATKRKLASNQPNFPMEGIEEILSDKIADQFSRLVETIDWQKVAALTITKIGAIVQNKAIAWLELESGDFIPVTEIDAMAEANDAPGA